MKISSNDNINLNRTPIWTGDIECGKTQNILIKYGRIYKLMDIERNVSGMYIEVYNQLDKVRNRFSKYDAAAERQGIHLNRRVEDNTWLDREFFEHFGEIAQALRTMENFKKYFK